jgi:hypothetical protein
MVPPNTGWHVSPQTFTATIAPGETLPVTFNIGVHGSVSRPAPKYTVEIAVGDRNYARVTRELSLARKVLCHAAGGPAPPVPLLLCARAAFAFRIVLKAHARCAVALAISVL